MPRGAGAALTAMRAVFGNPLLRRLECAWAASVFGQWFYNVALGVYAFQADGASGVALVALVRFGLSGLVAPATSLLGDRFARRSVMLGSDFVRAAAISVAAVAVLMDAPAPVVYAMAVVSTAASTAFHPAEAALLPELARTPDELTAANVVSGTLSNTAGLLGPALGGLLFAVTDASVVFAVTAVAFLVSAAFLIGLPAGAPSHEPLQLGLGAALAGFLAVHRDHRLRVVIGLYTASAVTWGMLSVVVVVMALEDLGMGEEGAGYLLGAISLGGLAGGAGAAMLAGSGHLARALGLATLVWGLPLVAIAWIMEPWMALVALAMLGVGESLIEVTTMTLLQRTVQDEVRARVFGVLESLTVWAVAIGGAVAAPLLSAFGTRGTLLVAGLALPALAIATQARLNAIDREFAAPTAEIQLLRSIPVFAPLPVPVLEGLAHRLATETVGTGTIVIREGEVGGRFYIVERGALRVTQAGAVLGGLSPGDFFGEIALLRRVPRTATVTASEECVLRILDGAAFVAAVTGHAPSADAAESVVESRLSVRAPQGVA